MEKKLQYKRICIFLLFSILTQIPECFGQIRNRHFHEVPRKQTSQRIQEHLSKVYTQTADSLENMVVKFRDKKHNVEEEFSNPYYFPLFATSTYFQAPIHRLIGTTAKNRDKLPLNIDHVQNILDSIQAHVYTASPWYIKAQEDDEKQNISNERDLIKEVRPQVNLSNKNIGTEQLHEDDFAQDWRVTIRKPNFWNFKANTSLQLMQNHISDNWYKGGESNYSWLVQLNLEATYNNKQKIVFTNTLESKLGFLSTNNDDKHKFRTNSDMLRMTNKLGLRATKHWYYTFMLQSWTQFYRGYRSNDTKVYSDFMSPFETLFSIGMDYNLQCKKFNMSATVSPIAADLKYVDRKYLATSFGIDDGKHSKLSYGSNITIRYNWNICKNVSWNSRIYYYTDYSKAQLEWENTFNLKINKYLSTQLFLYPRFDDSAKRGEGSSYFQFKEFLSFGLNMSF